MVKATSGRRQGARLAALYEISQLVVGTADPDRATLEVFNALQERLSILGGLMGLRDQESGTVEVVAASGYVTKPRRDPHFRWAVSLMESVISSGYPQVISDVREITPERTALDTTDQCWVACVPIRVRGRTSGALLIEQSYRDKEGAFEEAVNFLRLLGMGSRLVYSACNSRSLARRWPFSLITTLRPVFSVFSM